MNKISFEDKIENKTLVVGIIGLGYVGLPLSMTYCKKDFKVIGFDNDPKKINSLLNKKNYISDIDDEILSDMLSNKLFLPTNEPKELSSCDVIFICVPTPITKNRVPDISYIKSATQIAVKYSKKGVCIILKSTTFPGTTEDIMVPLFENNYKKIDKDYFLSFSPERIDPGNKIWNSDNTPIVVGGVTKTSGQIAESIIKSVIPKVHKVSSSKIAEMEKLLENIFRSVNIALVNEMAQMCDRIGGIDIWEVINAAATKPFGFMPFRPGPGIGGHCIQVDPYYLSYCARGHDFHSEFIELAAKTNENMPHYVVDELIKFLIKNCKNIYSAKILFFGVAFKTNVSDTRNSPAIKIIELLNRIGFKEIEYVDPFVDKISIGNKVYNNINNYKQKISEFDCCVISTDHTSFDYEFISSNANLIFDTRNVNIESRDNYHLIGSGKL